MNPHLSNSQSLDGYRLVRFLGRGGFGDVWLCRSEAMGDLRALKWIPATHADRLEKEYESLLHYRTASARLRSPHLLPIEHVNRNENGLYYVMPLADGVTNVDPADPLWQPLSLAAKIHAQTTQPHWFSSQEILAWIGPVLVALQTLSDVGLVHRDVKPENILFFNGLPCLGDISLLGADASIITRRGTPGYATPSWYVGGHPDMFGAAATLYTLLTGNFPDKMGRSAFLWPPQGESSLSDSERTEWKRLHHLIRRAIDEKVSERFIDFSTLLGNIRNDLPSYPKLPKILVSVLTIAGIAAATTLAAFRGKQAASPTPPAANPPPSSNTTAPNTTAPNTTAPKTTDPKTPPQETELTPEERADYTAMAGMIQGYFQDEKFEHALVTIDDLLATYPQARTQPSYSIARAMALKALGRNDEAKQELKNGVNLSTQTAAMAARKELWEQLGDLPEAENDLTRILNKFGPNILPLFLRADVRAQQGNFPGVHADRQAACAAKPEELEQRSLVDTMWKPLETKYPGYADYLRTLPPESRGNATHGAGGTSNLAEDNAWIFEVFNSISTDIVTFNTVISPEVAGVRCDIVNNILTGLHTGNYAKSLESLDQAWKLDPSLVNSPVLSLFRSLLLKRLGRHQESSRERIKLCHQDTNPRLIDARVCLLSALDRKREAQELLTRMIAAIPEADPLKAEKIILLLALRAKMRAILGDFPGVKADQAAALALVPAVPETGTKRQISMIRYDSERKVRQINTAWNQLQTQYPAYADFLKSLPEK